MEQIEDKSQTKLEWNEDSWKSDFIPGNTFEIDQVEEQGFDLDTVVAQWEYDKNKRIECLVPQILAHCVSDTLTPSEKTLQSRLKTHCTPRIVHLIFKRYRNNDWDMVIYLTNKYISGTLISTASVSRIPEQVRPVKAAFESEFQDIGKYRTLIHSQLCTYSSQWDEGKYYFPGVAIVQSSGTGKSRTVTSLVDLGVYVIYCSLMPESSSGYPGRSIIADSLMVRRHGYSEKEIEMLFLSFFLACKSKVDDAVKEKINPKEFLEQQIANGSGKEWNFWRSVQRKMEEITKNDLENLSKIRELVKEYFPSIEDSTNLKVLFVFDEASSLLPKATTELTRRLSPPKPNLFLGMSRGARRIPSKSGAFIAMLATTARISDIAPPKRLDKSGCTGSELFEPILELASFDFARPSVVGRKLEDAFVPENMFSYGRALWPSLLGQRQSPNSVRNLAASKLMGGNHPFLLKKSVELSDMQAFSLLRARFPILVCDSSISSELVSGYLWHCVFISADRCLVTSTMPSEPIVSEAACLWLSRPRIRADAFDIVSSALTSGILEPGTGVEMTAQALWILARDKVASVFGVDQIEPNAPSYFSVPLKLKHVFFALFAHEYAVCMCQRSHAMAQETGLQDVLEFGKVTFTHFVYVHTFPSMEQLLLLFARGAAVTCRVGETGIDLLIPVLMPNLAGEYFLDVQYLTYVFVQVKTRSAWGKDKNYPVSATKKLVPSSTTIKAYPPRHLHLSVYMDFGGKQTWPEFLDSESLLDDSGKPKVSLTKLDGILVRDKAMTDADYEARWLAARTQMGTLDATETEILRRHRQICIAVLGFDHAVYPCILSKPFDSSVIPASSGEVAKDDKERKAKKPKLDVQTRPLGRKKVQNIALCSTPQLKKQDDVKMLKSLHVMIRSGKDPASLQKSEKRSDYVKVLCGASYPEVLTDPKFREKQTITPEQSKAGEEKSFEVEHSVIIEYDDHYESDAE